MRKKSITNIILTLSPSIVLVALGMDIVIPCIPAIAQTFTVPFATAQWVLSIYFIGTGIGQIIIGPLADRYGRRKVILSAITIYIFSSFACAISDNIGQIIVARLLQGMGACGATVVVMAVIRDRFEDHITPIAYSYVNSVTTIAPILAPLLGGYMLVWFSTWRCSFYFVTLFGIFALLINYFYLDETNPKFNRANKMVNTNVITAYKQILTNTEYLSFTFCAISGLTGLFLFFSMSPILMIDILQVPANIYGYYFGFNFIIYFLGNLSSAKIQNELGVDNTIQVGNAFMVGGALLMLWWNFAFGLSIAGLMLPALIMSFGIGLIYGPCMAKAMRSFKHIAGTASASYGAMLYCSCALIVAIVMQNKIDNTLPFAITTLTMGCLNLLVVLLNNRRVKPCKL
jgi:DHA1 family florfenicol/chloramphenicol resistance protein-like MFS transporter